MERNEVEELFLLIDSHKLIKRDKFVPLSNLLKFKI